ncbi:Hypothetical predicted protein, partial [Paramuricea clavata]
MSTVKLNRVLIKGSIPTRDTTDIATPNILSQRGKRQVRRGLCLHVPVYCKCIVTGA